MISPDNFPGSNQQEKIEWIQSAKQEADRIIQSNTDNQEDLHRAVSLLDKSIALLEEYGDRRGIALCLWSQGQALLNLGERQAATEAIRRCAQIEEEENLLDDAKKSRELAKRLDSIEPGSADDVLLSSHGSDLRNAHSMMQKGLNALRSGRVDDALEQLQKSVDLHDDIPFWQGKVTSRAAFAQALALMEDEKKCISTLNKAIKIASENDDPAEAVKLKELKTRLKEILKVDLQKNPTKKTASRRAWSTKAFHFAQKTLYSRNDLSFPEAIKKLETALEIDRELNDQDGECHILILMGHYCMIEEDFSKAVKNFSQCSEIASKNGNNNLADKASELLRSARVQKETAELAVKFSDEKKEILEEGLKLMNSGMNEINANHHPEAISMLREAHKIFEDLEAWLPLAQSKVLLAQGLYLNGEKSDSEKLMQAAISIHEDHNDPENAEAIRKLGEQLQELMSHTPLNSSSSQTVEQNIENRLTEAYMSGDNDAVAHLMLELALFKTASDDFEHASQTFTRAADMFEKMNKSENPVSASELLLKLSEICKKMAGVTDV